MSKDRVISEKQIGKNLGGSGRGLILRYYPGISLERLVRTRNVSVRTAGIPAEI
jgi:hypothetical protein